MMWTYINSSVIRKSIYTQTNHQPTRCSSRISSDGAGNQQWFAHCHVVKRVVRWYVGLPVCGLSCCDKCCTLVCQFADCHVVTSVVRWFATLRIVILEPVLSVGWFASGGAFQILWLMLALWRWVRESFQTSRVCSYYARTLKSIGSKSECALSTFIHLAANQSVCSFYSWRQIKPS